MDDDDPTKPEDLEIGRVVEIRGVAHDPKEAKTLREARCDVSPTKCNPKDNIDIILYIGIHRVRVLDVEKAPGSSRLL